MESLPENSVDNIVASSEEEWRYVLNQLAASTAQRVNFTQNPPHQFLNFVIKEGEVIVGGINAELYAWGILYVSTLWVAEDYRGKGYGTQLLKFVEEEAKTQGGKLIHLECFDFQDKHFYENMGYQEFGVLEDCPPGHKRYYLKKNISS